MRKIIINENIFEKFPTFNRGIIVVENIENNLENKLISELLKSEINKKIGFNYQDNEYIKSWDNVHLLFNSNPNKFPPSIKSLLKRIKKNNELPFINSVVALFNYISIKYLIPCGGDDVDKIDGNLCLGFSNNNENFISLGSTEKETPEKNEVIYFDDKTLNVMCRKWNWRNGDFTKITENSKNIIINIDGIGENMENTITEATKEWANLLETQCNAKIITNLLNKNKREMEINI